MTQAQSQSIKRDPYIHHDLVQPTSSKLELNIMVGSVNLSVGRNINEKDHDKMANTVALFKYLDEKVVDEVRRNPNFGWTNLAEWRSWATGYVAEFVNKSLEEQAEQAQLELERIAELRRAGK